MNEPFNQCVCYFDVISLSEHMSTSFRFLQSCLLLEGLRAYGIAHCMYNSCEACQLCLTFSEIEFSIDINQIYMKRKPRL